MIGAPHAASGSPIVKGLAAIVLAAYNGKSPADILAFDIEDTARSLT